MWWKLELEISSVLFTSPMTQIIPDVSIWSRFAQWCLMWLCFCENVEIEGLKRKLTSKLAPTASSIQPEWQVNKDMTCLVNIYIYIQWNCGLEDTCLVKELISTVSLFTKHYNWCRLENVLRYGGAQILRLFCIPTNLPILLSQRYASKRLQFGLSMTNNVQLSYILPFLANYVKGTLSEIPSFLKCTFNIGWIP